MIKVIFNADDFGFSKGVNKGVAHSIKKGVVSSTSLLTNMPSTEDAFSIIKKNNLKEIGVHLNITDGKSLTGRSSITDKKGNFIGAYNLLLKLFLNKISTGDLKEEFKHQIENVIDRGITPTHINSHMYLHACKPVCRIFIRLARKYNIKNIRNSYDSGITKDKFIFLNSQYYKMIFINSQARLQKKILKKSNIKTTDYFHGILQMSCKNPLAYFSNIVNSMRKGTHEVMCHPGYSDDELKKLSPYTIARGRELKALCSPVLKDVIKKRGIKIMGFDDL